MINSILGTKKSMSQVFNETGRIPVTKVSAGPCIVTQITQKNDEIWGIQIGYGEKKIKKTTKPLFGHLKKVVKKGDKTVLRYLREIETNKEPGLKIGDQVKVSDIFFEGDTVSVTGTSKGKGFTGVIKRWGFATSGRTHGQKSKRRAPGSIGQGTTPGRVHKGKKMAGRSGHDKVTIQNLKVVSVLDDKNEIVISGTIPGVRNSLLLIKKTKSAAKKGREESTAERLQSTAGKKEKEKSTDGLPQSKTRSSRGLRPRVTKSSGRGKQPTAHKKTEKKEEDGKKKDKTKETRKEKKNGNS